MDVVQAPCLVQDGRLQPVHAVANVIEVIGVAEEGALELFVQVADPRSLSRVRTTGNLVDLVLEFLQT